MDCNVVLEPTTKYLTGSLYKRLINTSKSSSDQNLNKGKSLVHDQNKDIPRIHPDVHWCTLRYTVSLAEVGEGYTY